MVNGLASYFEKRRLRKMEALIRAFGPDTSASAPADGDAPSQSVGAGLALFRRHREQLEAIGLLLYVCLGFPIVVLLLFWWKITRWFFEALVAAMIVMASLFLVLFVSRVIWQGLKHFDD